MGALHVTSNTDTLMMLVNKGADVNIQNEVHDYNYLVCHDNLDNKFSNQNVCNVQNGDTPCMMAAGDGALETVKILCRHGAQMDIQNMVTIKS